VTKKTIDTEVQAALAWLKRTGTQAVRDAMGPEHDIHVDKAFGVSMPNIRILAKKIGTDHELAIALWETGWHEARLLACLVDDPEEVSSLQMDSWCKDFDNWAIADAACIDLFDKTPHAWWKLAQWGKSSEPFQKRAAFILLWRLAVHDKKADNTQFINSLVLIERAAEDDRHFVKKSLDMALRAIGKRNLFLNEAASTLAQRLALSSDATQAWIGKEALRELTSPVLIKRLSEK